MLLELGIQTAELSVLLTNDAEIKELNREHRGKDKPTDVLAFALEEADVGPMAEPLRILGDVVISLETADRQARQRRHELRDEVVFLLAHGLLHLLGYDHQTDRQERKMNEETRRLVTAVGASGRSGGASSARGRRRNTAGAPAERPGRKKKPRPR